MLTETMLTGSASARINPNKTKGKCAKASRGTLRGPSYKLNRLLPSGCQNLPSGEKYRKLYEASVRPKLLMGGKIYSIISWKKNGVFWINPEKNDQVDFVGTRVIDDILLFNISVVGLYGRLTKWFPTLVKTHVNQVINLKKPIIWLNTLKYRIEKHNLNYVADANNTSLGRENKIETYNQQIKMIGEKELQLEQITAEVEKLIENKQETLNYMLNEIKELEISRELKVMKMTFDANAELKKRIAAYANTKFMAFEAKRTAKLRLIEDDQERIRTAYDKTLAELKATTNVGKRLKPPQWVNDGIDAPALRKIQHIAPSDIGGDSFPLPNDGFPITGLILSLFFMIVVVQLCPGLVF